MKISELIEKLKELQKKHGDLECCFDYGQGPEPDLWDRSDEGKPNMVNLGS